MSIILLLLAAVNIIGYIFIAAFFSGGAVTLGIVFIVILILIDAPFILAIIKAIIDDYSKNQKKIINTNKNTHGSKLFTTEKRLYNYSDKQILALAKAKMNNISSKQKMKYLKNRKKFFKKIYISVSLFLLTVSLIGLILLLVGFNKIFSIVIMISFLDASVIVLIAFVIIFNRKDEKLIIEQIKKELKKIYSNITNDRLNSYKSYVKRHSIMWKNIEELNKSYDFNYSVCRLHEYFEYFKSKRQFDFFDAKEWLYMQIDSNISLFNTLINTYTKDSILYVEYSKKYNLLERYMLEKEMEGLDLDYETFNLIEQRLYREGKQRVISAPSIKIEYSYTSPSGRNYYVDRKHFSYTDIIKALKEYEHKKLLVTLDVVRKEKAKRQIQERKEQLQQKRREKEKRLRELNKFEKELQEKVCKLDAQKAEFEKATKGHIYSSQKIINENHQETQIDKNDTPYIKIKKLRQKFENGEISFEEYNKQKKELI